jgi:hypothetical protein
VTNRITPPFAERLPAFGDWSQFDGRRCPQLDRVWVVGSSNGSSFSRHWRGDS